MFNRRRFPTKTVMAVCFLLLLVILPFSIIESNLKPTILAVAKAHAEQVAVRAIEDAVNEKVSKSVEYRDLIFIRTDNRGRVVLMQANTVKINSLAADTTLEIQKSLAKLEGKVIPIVYCLYGRFLRANTIAIPTITTAMITPMMPGTK